VGSDGQPVCFHQPHAAVTHQKSHVPHGTLMNGQGQFNRWAAVYFDHAGLTGRKHGQDAVSKYQDILKEIWWHEAENDLQSDHNLRKAFSKASTAEKAKMRIQLFNEKRAGKMTTWWKRAHFLDQLECGEEISTDQVRMYNESAAQKKTRKSKQM